MPLYKLNQNLISPKAEAVWPKLVTPSVYAPKGSAPDPKDKGKWSVKLKLNPDNSEHAKYIEQVERCWEELEARVMEGEGKARIKLVEAPVPIVDEEDEEGNPTGLKLIRFSKKAGGIKRNGEEWKAEPPAIIDSAKAPFPLPEGQELANGSILRVASRGRAYQMAGKWGMVLDLQAVMVIEPQFFDGAGGADAFADVPPEDFDADSYQATDGDF